MSGTNVFKVDVYFIERVLKLAKKSLAVFDLQMIEKPVGGNRAANTQTKVSVMHLSCLAPTNVRFQHWIKNCWTYRKVFEFENSKHGSKSNVISQLPFFFGRGSPLCG